MTEETTTPTTVEESKVVDDTTEESPTKPTDDPADGTANDGTPEEGEVTTAEKSTSQAPKEEKVGFFKRLFACGTVTSKPAIKAIEETPVPDEADAEKEDIPMEGAPSLEEKKTEDSPVEEANPEDAQPESMEVEAPKELAEGTENAVTLEKTDEVDTKSLVCGCL